MVNSSKSWSTELWLLREMANEDSYEKVYVLVLYTGGTIGMKETSDGKKVN